jgi:hypothetical protein
VVLKHRSGATLALHRLLRDSGLDGALVDSGRIVLADAARFGAQTGGRRELLAELLADLLAEALADGYAGLAMTGDSLALQTLYPGVGELAAHERDVVSTCPRSSFAASPGCARSAMPPTPFPPAGSSC